MQMVAVGMVERGSSYGLRFVRSARRSIMWGIIWMGIVFGIVVCLVPFPVFPFALGLCAKLLMLCTTLIIKLRVPILK
jgi:hypothetical protein